MAWSTASVSADELAAKAAGYPAFIGTNVLERVNNTPQWRASGSWASGTNITDSAGPGRMAYDRRQKVQTFPTSAVTSVSAVSLLFDVVSSTIESAKVDTVGIFGHNFNSISNLTGVYVEIADDNAFSTNLQAITSWTSATDWGTTDTLRPIRLIDTNLTSTGADSNQRLAGLTYVRVRLTASSSFSVIPKIGEVWLGRRQQLTMHGQLPFPERPLNSSSADFRTESGDFIRHALFSGGSDREVEFNLGGTVLYDCETQLREWQNQISYGQKSFIYIEDMSTVDTDRRAWVMIQDPPEFAFTNLGPFEDSVSVGMVELPPFVSSET